MRDVLEIDYQLKDFAIDPDLIDEWLSADNSRLVKKFGPGAVRKRLEAAGVPGFGVKAESLDYRGHSQMLHLNPRRTILPSKGLAPDDPFGNDMGFWEIFDHARSLWTALIMLAKGLAPGSDAERIVEEEPAQIFEAWKQTNFKKTFLQAIFEAGLTKEDAAD
jgi:hypothetical protein